MEYIIEKCLKFIKNNRIFKFIGYKETYEKIKHFLPEYDFVSIEDYNQRYGGKNEKGVGWIVIFLNVHQYIAIEKLLKKEGNTYLINYCPYYFFIHELLQKEYILFVGECQLEDIANAFFSVQKDYLVCYIDVRFANELNDALQNLFDMCKVAVINNYPKAKSVINKFNIDSEKTIKIPFFSFWGIWPQIEQVIEKRNPLNIFSKKDKGPFPIADININNAIKNGETLEEVINKVNTGYYIKDCNIDNYFKKSLRLFDLMTLDEDKDIKELFEKMIYKMDVLRDPTHLQVTAVKEIVIGLIEKIDKNIKIIENNVNLKINNTCTEMIIYPHIIETLNFEHLRNKKYAVRRSLREEVDYFSYENWIRYYYEYCSFVYKKGRY